jgi:hypothetical protein
LVSVFQVVGTNSRRCFFNPEFEEIVDQALAQRNRDVCGTGNTSSNPLSNGTYNEYRTGNGVGYYASMDYTTDQHGWFAEVGGRSRDYRADAGFTRRTNANFAFFVNRFSTKSKPKAKLIRASWAQFTGVDYDWAGRLLGHNMGSNLQLQMPRSTFLFLEVGAFHEKIYEEEFGLKRTPTRPLGTFYGEGSRDEWQTYGSINMNQTLNKKFNYGFFIGLIRNSFDYFNFHPSGFQDPVPGRQFDVEIWGEYKPIDPLRISFNYRKSRLDHNEDRVRAFDSDIVSLKTTYQFTRFVFARVRVDYRSDVQNFAGQALFGWTPSPGTAFYVGYNDNFNYNGINPNTGQVEPGVGRNERTFFIRASYLFRKSF